MAANSKITWTEATWNCLSGCEAVSPGCAHCYAATMTRRLEAMGQADYAGLTTAKHFNGVVRCLPHKLDVPLKWRKPRRVFVNSMSDLFHESVPDEFIDKVFAVMAMCPQHTFQVLTKRAERMHRYCSDPETAGRVESLKHVIAAGRLNELDAPERIEPINDWPGYFVTSKGRVLSDRTKAGSRKEAALHELKPQYGEQGHARVMLQVEGRKERPLIHRLVLSHFDRHAEPGEQGCHINGDATINALWNLKWGGQPDNWNDSKRHGTRRRYSKLSPDDVAKIRLRLSEGESSSAVALDVGVSDTQIRNIATGTQWQPEHQPEWPLNSVWLGISAEDQQRADERIPWLLKTPAAVRFISAEPLIGPINFDEWLSSDYHYFCCDCDDNCREDYTACPDYPQRHGTDGIVHHGLSWLIVGGESGPGARECNVEWIRSIVAQCKAAGVACFVKQLGSKPFEHVTADMAKVLFPAGVPAGATCAGSYEHYRTFNLRDRKGGDPKEWPADLRVREMPGEVVNA